jgi:hypothetical protein
MPGFPGEVDLNFKILMTNSGFDFVPSAEFFSCESLICGEDFIMPQSGLTQCVSGFECSGVAYPVELLGFSATQVPEPSSLKLAFCGFLFLGILFGLPARNYLKCRGFRRLKVEPLISA